MKQMKWSIILNKRNKNEVPLKMKFDFSTLLQQLTRGDVLTFARDKLLFKNFIICHFNVDGFLSSQRKVKDISMITMV